MDRDPSKENFNIPGNFIDLLDDTSFVDYLLYGSGKEIWEEKIANNPALKDFIEETRRVVNLLNTSEQGLTNAELEKMWLSVRAQHSLVVTRRNRIKHFLRFAASFIVLLGIGTAIWLFSSNLETSQSFEFSPNVALSPSGESTLILPGGSLIELQNDENPVTVLADGEIIANNNLISRSTIQGGNLSQRMNQVIVPFGRKTELILPDGTQVFLNAGSKLAFPSEFSSRQRLVHLEGEAFFKVTHNPTQPFMVIVNELMVKVLGTQFNINGHGTDSIIETVVIEGVVSLSENTKSRFPKKGVEVTASMKASFAKDTKSIALASVPNPSIYSAWTSGWLIFERENLYGILSKMERYYDVNFIYDRQISDATISGKLDLKDSVQDVVTALADVAEFAFTIDENNVYLKQKLKQLPVK